MARPGLSKEEKEREGQTLRVYIDRAKALDDSLTDEALAAEMGITQGLIGQWLSGHTRIKDESLVWLADRLGFDPVEFRPSISLDALLSGSPGSAKLAQELRRIPRDQAEYVSDAVSRALEDLKQKQ